MDNRILLTMHQLREFHDISPTLLDILESVAFFWPINTNIYITSIWRSLDENAAVSAKTQIHTVGPPYRSMDLRVWNLGDNYESLVRSIEENVNIKWMYDVERPTLNVAYGKLHGSGPHLHIQSHPNTEKRL